MHASPNVLTALWSARYRRSEIGQRQESVARQDHGVQHRPRPAQPPKSDALDYGCVEWYFYDEKSTQSQHGR